MPKPSLGGGLALKVGRMKGVTSNSSKCFLNDVASFFCLCVFAGLSSARKEEIVLS